MRKSTLTAVLAATVVSSAIVANTEAALVAQWTFNSGDATGLVDSVAGYTLTPRNAGSSPALAYNSDGTVSLSSGQQLYTTAINSTDLPALTSNATIYLRMRFDGFGTGTGQGGSFASFTNGSGLAASYSDATNGTSLSGFTNTTGSAATYGRTDLGNGIAPGSGFPTFTVGQFIDVAVVFNNLTDLNGAASATKSSATLYLNGQLSTRDANGTAMAAFAAFALGRTATGGSPGATSFDLVQIYDEALSPAQIAAIPEPASLAGLALAGGALLRRRRQK